MVLASQLADKTQQETPTIEAWFAKYNRKPQTMWSPKTVGKWPDTVIHLTPPDADMLRSTKDERRRDRPESHTLFPQ